MLLSYIPDLVQSNTPLNKVYQLYEAMVRAWLERENVWVDEQKLREFSERLAIDIYTKRETRGAERIPYEELISLEQTWQIDLENWQISGRSLLNRDAKGNYKFAHRSIMEYLFAVRS